MRLPGARLQLGADVPATTRSAALYGGDRFRDGGKEVLDAQLLEEGTVLEVVVDEVRGPGDSDRHVPLPELRKQVPQGLQAGVVNVGHAVGVEDEGFDRIRRLVEEVTDPQPEVVGVSVPERRVHEVHEDPRDLLGGTADIERDPVVGARLTTEERVARTGGTPGPVRQRNDDGDDDALLDTDQGHEKKRSSCECKLDAVELEDGS